MRSLSLLSQSSLRHSEPLTGDQACLHVNPETNDVYLAGLEDTEYVLSKIVYNQDGTTLKPQKQPILGFPAEESGRIVNIHFLIDTQTVCIAFAKGAIGVIDGDQYDVVGEVESGIRCMEWSPDEELVVIVSGVGTIMIMTKDFDAITEFPINVDEEGEAAPISLGWGKKETQFHGSEGKRAAQVKFDISQYTKSSDDDMKTRISWCGDGSYFCCSEYDSTKGRRVIRIYNREGILQNTSEPVDQLEHVLSWRPAGNLIASSQRLPHRHIICFFERNGLRHGDFVLRETGEHRLVEVAWNCDSTILAVWLVRKDASSSVQLWSMNNYHWYLKQEINSSADDQIVAIQWDTEISLRLYLVTKFAYRRLDYSWEVFSSPILSPHNNAAAAVIDGSSLLLTPFKHMNVPPPMSAFTLSLPAPASYVSFGPFNRCNDFSVLLNNSQLALFDWTTESNQLHSPPIEAGIVNLSEYESIRHVLWKDQKTFVFVNAAGIEDKEEIVAIGIDVEGKQGQDDKEKTRNLVVIERAVLKLEKSVVRLWKSGISERVFIQDFDGDVYEVLFNTETSPTSISLSSLVTHLPESCPHVASIDLPTSTETPIIIAQSERNKLYANDRLIAADCTSFFVHNKFLIFTTLNHHARFLSINADDEIKELGNTVLVTSPDVKDETTRRVERGSKIIIAVQFGTSLILQMPRGNLETIHPRPLVLSTVYASLDALDYRPALLSCRKHRLDLNIIHNYAPQIFLQNVGNGDPGTINTICDSIRGVLESADFKKYIQPILTTYVKKTPADLEGALNVLADTKQKDPILAESALKYMIFLADADRLYDIALGMYDFSLVLMVAQQSQKDPREYLSFLTEIQKHDKYYQRFKIDDHLKRHEKAVRNLALAGDKYFDECLKYTQKHGLYLTALESFEKRSDKYKVVIELYGDYLMSEQKYEEAGVAYKLSETPRKALEAYKAAGSWREAIIIAQQLEFSPDDIVGLSREISEILVEKRQYVEAARMLLDYTGDPEEAIPLFGKGYQWSEAIRICYLRNRRDLIETHVKPSISEGYEHVIEDITEMSTQFHKQTKRLVELKEKRMAQEEDYTVDQSIDNVDVMSDTSSMASDFTRYTVSASRLSTASKRTAKSAKTRRREDRKRARGKKGSPYEVEYLFDSLSRLVDRFNTLQGDVKTILHTFMSLAYVDKAKNLQNSFGKLEEDIVAGIEQLDVNASAYIPVQVTLDDQTQPMQAEFTKPSVRKQAWKIEVLENL